MIYSSDTLKKETNQKDMKKINTIFHVLIMCCVISVLGSCKNDDWSEVYLENTPVYELYNLKDAVTNTAAEVTKFSVYRELMDLIAWQNDFQTSRLNKIEFFSESTEQPEVLPDGLEIDASKEQYLSFSFNEVFTVTEEQVNPETGEKEEKEVIKKRLFLFEGKKELNSSAGFGYLTVVENDGTKVTYKASLNDVLKPADRQ